jgi:CBS domain containing-hemolysin-like protein
MTLFVISVGTVLTVSALCSLTEAALYAVSMTYVRQLASAGTKAGTILSRFKQNMEEPITAILIINTAANTAGASIAGAQARELFGESSLIWFAVLFTVAVLICSEILPKVAGVAHSRPVARAASVPLLGAVNLLQPFVRLSQIIARPFKPDEPVPFAPEDEVHQMAALSAEEGSILPIEAELVKNVLHLDQVVARDIMTPRPVVYRLALDKTVGEVGEEVVGSPHSRIPLYDPDDPDHWPKWVSKQDILVSMARDAFDQVLDSLATPLGVVSEMTHGQLLLSEFLKRKELLLGVVNEYGGMTGVVALEDVMESLIGREIVDETDTEEDMQEAARRRIIKQYGDSEVGDTAGHDPETPPPHESS